MPTGFCNTDSSISLLKGVSAGEMESAEGANPVEVQQPEALAEPTAATETTVPTTYPGTVEDTDGPTSIIVGTEAHTEEPQEIATIGPCPHLSKWVKASTVNNTLSHIALKCQVPISLQVYLV